MDKNLANDKSYTQLCNSLEAMMLPIPNRMLQPKGVFETNIPLIVGVGDSPKPKVVDLLLICTYEGTRQRNQRSEALILVAGEIKGRSAETKDFSGYVTGKFGFDTAGGFISLAQIKLLTEDEAPGGNVQFSYTLEVALDRQAGNPMNIPLPPEKKVQPKENNHPLQC